jgi:hypothetical protein
VRRGWSFFCEDTIVNICPHCKNAAPSPEDRCPMCGGRGRVLSDCAPGFGIGPVDTTCDSCDGSGQVSRRSRGRIYIVDDQRPKWCGHKDCQCLVTLQDTCCGGRLPRPVPHDEDFNTHRICIETEGVVFDLMVNRTDVFVLGRLFSAVHLDTLRQETGQ